MISGSSPLTPSIFSTNNIDIPHHLVPDILTEEQVKILKNYINRIDKAKCVYEEFSKRKGITWDNFWVTTPIGMLPQIEIERYNAKIIDDQKKLKHVYPISLFDDPKFKDMEVIGIVNCLIKRFFQEVMQTFEKNKNYHPPFYFQSFLTRTEVPANTQSQPVWWHQDSGENYGPAQYSMVVLLSEPNEQNKWKGGEMRLRSLRREDSLITLIPAYKQAIIFDNETSEHMVTEIQAEQNLIQRDILILCMHLQAQKYYKRSKDD